MKYEFIEKLMNTKFRLFGLESKNPLEIKEHFKQLGRFTGQTVYIWEEGKGLYRTDAAHITIPNTASAKQEFKHIRPGKYQATYVLVGFNDYVHDFDNQNLLSDIAKAEGAHKATVMVDGKVELPSRLAKYTFETKKLVPVSIKSAMKKAA